MNAYLRIKEYNDSYTATEKLIAEYILENDILQDSAQALGEKTNTSAAAIIRFSKKIGFKGFSDLKMNLAQSTKEEEKQEVEVPNIIGMTEKEAKKALEDVGLQLEFKKSEEKEIITDQLPKAGIKTKSGTIIIAQ